jgi:peptidoglycan/LPS O-acetylase OafA/YrhL
VGTTHGFILGMIAFFFGFLFIAIGDAFWNAIQRMRYISLVIAVSLYLVRLFYFDLNGPNYLTSTESMSWIFSLMGFGYKYFNKPSKILSHLSQAAYPVYIIHMIFLYLASYLILPLNLKVGLNIIMIVLFTFTGCYITYEFVIKRITFIGPMFGLKRK